MQIITMDGVIEERFRKIENEELSRLFPINIVSLSFLLLTVSVYLTPILISIIFSPVTLDLNE